MQTVLMLHAVDQIKSWHLDCTIVFSLSFYWWKFLYSFLSKTLPFSASDHVPATRP